eukprot:XP_001697796.1 dynamin-related GTPase [Chlamydomonas reinhardtii]
MARGATAVDDVACTTTLEPVSANCSLLVPYDRIVVMLSGGATLADTAYQRTVRRVLNTTNTLRELGVDGDLQVPTLVIAGDQSSGKSSVVEASAGVPLPRSDGTCTRCPTEVRMRTTQQLPAATGVCGGSALSAAAASSPPGPHSGEDGEDDEDDEDEEDEEDDAVVNNAAGLPPGTTRGGGGGSSASAWQCRIKLCREFDSDGVRLATKPPEQPFCVVRDKAHIATCVLAAQAVLLNPRAVEDTPGGAGAFVPLLSSAQPGRQPAAAAKLLALRDASHYELPFTPNKDPRLIELVKDMVKANLAPEHHIIAMALPAGQDAETQAIRLMTREVDPDGRRSIGIITKPDRVPEHEAGETLKLIRLVGACGAPPAGAGAAGGSARVAHPQHPLGHYVVKNPSQDGLAMNITFEQARADEAAYFAGHKHWAAALRRQPELQRRMGAAALRRGLSGLLVELVIAQLPEMRRSCRELQAAVQEELGAMPQPIQDAPRELDRMLTRVAAALRCHTRADDDCTFYQRTQAMYDDYCERVMRCLPAFLVGTTLIGDAQLQQVWEGGALDVSALAAALGAPAVTTEAEAAAFLYSDEVQQLLTDHLLPQTFMTLAEVVELRQRHLGRELPGFSPYRAMECLLQRFKGQWRGPALACLGNVAAAAHDLTDQVVAVEFRDFPAGSRAVTDALWRRVEGLSDATAEFIEKQLRMEDRDVYPGDKAQLQELQADFLARMKRAYLRPNALSDEQRQQIEIKLAELATYGVKFASFDAAFLAQPTPVDDELHMAASCLAYFKVSSGGVGGAILVRNAQTPRLNAYAGVCCFPSWECPVAFGRVRASVPMPIRDTLLDRLGDPYEVAAAVQAAGQDIVAAAPRLLAEHPHLAARRLWCAERQQRLREALEALHSPAAGVPLHP